MSDFLIILYPWIKSLHVMAVLSWMAGIFYLPRLYVYHVEQAEKVNGAPEIFFTMEEKLYRFIMHPAMYVTWVCGLLLVITPGIVDWTRVWPWTKGISVIAMTLFHLWLGQQGRRFRAGENTLTGRRYRMMNEVPTLLMVVIVLSVIVKF
ncbi:CopD family protein [Pseudodonghicola flavimaris]|uniref:Protoporphyrinogen IX oxidase n=1 Tax=Pseudodonghicola flavimaris TaxID=3050036 RepID=A0ABT7EZU2_9RHOB|nr:CopD family protein [Pseudodonghicola flavimaris]MDK3017854.1 CopD family protein [Pseudodonghicola flavimaris]